jgi:hypothetical protein
MCRFHLFSKHTRSGRGIRLVEAGVLATIGLLSLTTAAHADDILAGGALFGSAVQKTAVCFVYNGGTTNVTLAVPRISGPEGFTLPRRRITARRAWVRGASAKWWSTSPATCLILVERS